MRGVMHVLEHPFFSVSDVEGRFEIRGLPPGDYTLEVLHESGRIGPRRSGCRCRPTRPTAWRTWR